MFVNLGDLFYSGTNWSKQKDFEYSIWEVVVKNKKQAEMYAGQQFLYVFDDHDLGSNNANQMSKSAPHAQASYRTMISSQGLVSEGINRATTAKTKAGSHIRFINIDARSFKNNKQNYGPEQIAWIKSELTKAEQDP